MGRPRASGGVFFERRACLALVALLPMRACRFAVLPLLWIFSALAEPTVLHCGRLFDARGLQLVAERTIVVEGNRIAAVEAGYRERPGATVVDLRERTCLPGLIDLHVHLGGALGP